jgi:integrase
MSSLANRNDKWQLDLYHQGRRVRANSGLPATPANRVRAEQMLAKVVAAAARGENPRTLLGLDSKTSGLTLGAFAERWLRQQAPAWRPSTVRTRRNSFGYLLGGFGGTPLAELNRAELLDWRAKLLRAKTDGGQGLSAQTVNRVLRDVGRLFAELLEQHPELRLGNLKTLMAKVRAPKTAMTPFTATELETLLDSVSPHWRPYLQLRVETGMRASEVDGLRWADVDLINGRLTVTSICVRGVRQPPKTSSGVRQLQLSSEVTALLRAVKQQAGDREAVFATERGRPLTENYFTESVWRPLLARCGVDYRRPHVLRHTYATLALAAGMPLNRLAARLGHSSIGPLVSVYAHLLPEVAVGAHFYL